MIEYQYGCEQVVPIEQEPCHHLVMANDFVRAFAVEVPPHDRTLCHHHAHEYLMYVAEDAEIVSAPRQGGLTTHSYRDGVCELSPPGLIHVVENLADTTFRNLLVEFLPALAGLRRGLAPKSVAGDPRIVRLFAHHLVAVFRLDIETGSKVEIYGPAIVASPYENQVELAVPRGGTHQVANFRDLFWLGSTTVATLGNRATTAAKVVLIAVGK